jgi:cytochrome c biogenesis protein CcmG/thiol:disulfide interchange protein DsbE
MDHKETHRMTETAPESEPTTSRKLPAWAVILGIGVVFIAGLLALLLIKPPQKSLCDEAAPDLTLALFPEYRGGQSTDAVSLADLKGKGVVLNFWASWCKPCEEEAAALEAAWRQYKDKGVVFVGVDYLDQDPSAKRYLEKFNITFPNGADLASKISKRYAIRGVPETFFIDPQGKIVGCRKIGPLTPSELRQRISEIMPK